jgi:signal peptidase I
MLPYLVLLFLLTTCFLLGGTFWFLRKGLLVVTVQGQSMSPTLSSGDRLLVLRRALAGRLRKGSIVVVRRAPAEMNQRERRSENQMSYVKRLVALSGETFTAPVHTVWLEEEEAFAGQHGTQTRSWVIPPEHLFVCGDNREHSVDSRIWGPLPSRNVVGVMLLKLTPAFTVTHVIPEPFLSSGDAAASFTALTVNDEVLTLDHYLGRPLALIFIAPTRFSRVLIPTCQALAEREERTFLFICDADREQAQALVQELQITLPVLIASRQTNPLLQDYHVPSTPAYCFIDAQGRVEASGLPSPQDVTWKTFLTSEEAVQQEQASDPERAPHSPNKDEG